MRASLWLKESLLVKCLEGVPASIAHPLLGLRMFSGSTFCTWSGISPAYTLPVIKTLIFMGVPLLILSVHVITAHSVSKEDSALDI